MTEPRDVVDRPAACSYRSGGWFGVVGAQATVLLPPSEKARVPALWALVDDGAGFDETLDALLAGGLRDLPGFVLVATEDGTTQVVLRGPASARFVAGGEVVELAGDPTSTWVERTLTGVTQLTVTVEDGDEEAAQYVVDAGLVRLARLDVPPYAAPPAEPPAGPPEDAGPEAVAEPPAVAEPDAEVGAELEAELVAEDEPVDEPEVLAEPADGPEVLDEPAPFDEPDPEPDPDPETDPVDDDQPTELMALPADGATPDLLPPPTAPPLLPPPPPPLLPPVPAGPSVAAPPPWAPPDPPPASQPSGWPPADEAVVPTPDPLTDPLVEPGPVVDEADDAVPANRPPLEPPVDHDGLTRAGGWQPDDFARPAPGIPGQPPAPSVTARPVARLTVSSTGETIDVDRVVVVGRAPEARRFTSTEQPRLVTVDSPHQEISSTHLEIRPGSGADHGSAVVTDLGSTNGTVLVQPGLGPEELPPGVAVQLVAGAVLDLGDGVTIRVTNP